MPIGFEHKDFLKKGNIDEIVYEKCSHLLGNSKIIISEQKKSILKKINGKNKLSIIHQSGEKMFELLKESYEGADFKVETRKYIFDMEKKYNWADIVIARSGALTVSELITSGTASILIPYPFAVDDHQFLNAKILKDAGAAEIIREKDLEEKLVLNLAKLDRKKCENMALKAKELHSYDACAEVRKVCNTLLK